MKKQRVHIFYEGRVQGVGFRYTVEEIALKLGVTGWVRNLPNGVVEMLAEGKSDDLHKLMQEIKASVVGRHIKLCRQTWEDYQGEYSDFRIEFVT